MTQGLWKLQIQQREGKKQTILKFIQNHPTTYVNAIVEVLHMSKTTVVKCVQELLESKQIILLKDSYNTQFTQLTKIKKRNQLVYYDPMEEERGKKKFNYKDDVQVSNIPFNYLRTLEYRQISKDLRNSSQKTKASLQELITDFKNSNESEKKAKTPFLNYALNEYAKLELLMEKLDHRVKYTKFEKILVAYSIAGRFTIHHFSKLENVSEKYVSRLSKQYPVSKDDSRYTEFKKMVGCCSNCGSSVADGLIEKIKQ